MSAATRRGRALVAAVVLAATAACSPLPESGGVRVEEPPDSTRTAAPFDFHPPGPQPGSTREQVVAGFLRALQATPTGTAGAAEFLTAEAVEQWRPDRRTVVYDRVRTRPGEGRVTVHLDGAFVLDGQGRWRGPTGTAARPATAVLRLEREEGEWRIAGLPDATLVPRSHFATRYRRYSVYFFDATGSVLVPEPVYLPWGPQAPTALVGGLLAGPPADARGLVRSYFPRSARLEVSVPVSESGVAEVPLSAEVADLDESTLQRVVAQLAWTLRQVPEVRSLRLTVDGAPVEPAEGRTTIPVTGSGSFDPAVASASTDLFGIRGRAVRQVVGDEVIAAAGLGAARLAAAGVAGPGRPRALGVDMSGQRFAVLAPDRRRVAVVTRLPDSRVVAELAGTDLLRPLWDRTDRLWLLDRLPGGLVVRVDGPRRERRLTVPGLGGREVLAAALSRDGSRLGLLVGAGAAAALLVARVERTSAGAPVRIARARQVARVAGRAVDVGWRDPTTLAVLTRPTPATSEVVLASVDGASATLGLEPTPDVLYDEGVALATSPGGPQALLVATEGGRLHGLDVTGRWDLDAVPARLRAATFVG